MHERIRLWRIYLWVGVRDKGELWKMGSIAYCNSCHSIITMTLFEETSLSKEPMEIKRVRQHMHVAWSLMRIYMSTCTMLYSM